MVDIPFQYGREVTGDYFFDREEDLSKLMTYLTTGKNDLALYGIRRIGKTSLIVRLAEVLLARKLLPLVIKCEKLLPHDEITFCRNLVQELHQRLTALSTTEKVKALARNLLPEKIGLAVEDINFWIELGKGEKKDIKQCLDKSFELIDKMSDASKKKVVIFLDEFQELFPFGEAFLWALRSQISESKAVFVVSSSHHRFQEYLTQEKHPFFNFFQLYQLRGVAVKDAEQFLKARMKRGKLSWEEATLHHVVELCQGHPYYIQLLGFWCYERALSTGKKRIDAPILSLAYAEALKNIPAHLLSSFGKLKGKTKDVFVAMCLHNLTAVSEIGKRINMPANNVYQLLQQIEQSSALVQKVAEGKFEVTDHFLKDYVKQLYT